MKMRRMRQRYLFSAGSVALVAVAAVAIHIALAAPLAVQHGISFTKGCNGFTPIGSPLECDYTIRNNVDDAHDTLTFTALVDTVHSFPQTPPPPPPPAGDVTSDRF